MYFFLNMIDIVSNEQYTISFQDLWEALLKVWEESVADVVMDGASNCEGVKKLMMEKFKLIVDTPCSTHFMDFIH